MSTEDEEPSNKDDKENEDGSQDDLIKGHAKEVAQEYNPLKHLNSDDE